MKLEVRNLEKIYRTKKGAVQALAPTSFEVGNAEFVSLVGPSGCGKSTTLYMIAGLEEATRGEILLDGQRVHGPSRDRGMVFQNYTLFPWLSVLDNVRFPFELANNFDYSLTSAEVMTKIVRTYSLHYWMALRHFY